LAAGVYLSEGKSFFISPQKHNNFTVVHHQENKGFIVESSDYILNFITLGVQQGSCLFTLKRVLNTRFGSGLPQQKLLLKLDFYFSSGQTTVPF
jgi:hypothetical protein